MRVPQAKQERIGVPICRRTVEEERVNMLWSQSSAVYLGLPKVGERD